MTLSGKSSQLKSSQEYPVNAGVSQTSILGPRLFPLYINNLPDDVIYDITIYVWYLLSILMWSGIWSVATTRIGFWTWIWSTRHWTGAGSGLLISMLEKLKWFHLASLIILVLLMWKWMGLFLRKYNLLKCWGELALLICIGALTLSLLLKLPPIKLEPWFNAPEVALYLYKFTIWSCME